MSRSVLLYPLISILYFWEQSAIKPASSLGKGPWKKVIDLVLYVLFCAMVGTGMLLSYRLLHGDGTSRPLFLGFGRHEWGEIYTWIGFLSVALLVVHLFLNWQWLVKVAAFEARLATRCWHPHRSVNSRGVPLTAGKASCAE
jgi:hypothetical protein